MRARRLIAYFIDWYVVSFFMNLWLVILVYIQKKSIITNLIPIGYFEKSYQLVILLSLSLIEIIWYVIVPIFFNGQTLAKRLFRIRIVNSDGNKVTLLNLAKRDLIGCVLIEGAFSPLSNYARNVILSYTDTGVVTYLVYIATVMAVISIVVSFASRDGRMIHDYIGGTKVVAV